MNSLTFSSPNGVAAAPGASKEASRLFHWNGWEASCCTVSCAAMSTSGSPVNKLGARLLTERAGVPVALIPVSWEHAYAD